MRTELTHIPVWLIFGSAVICCCAFKTLGENLRTARLRRELTIQEIAQRIGTGPRAVADAEKGKPTTAIAIYVGLLWALGLIEHLGDVAAPGKDEEGLALSFSRKRARSKETLDNDF